MDEFELINRYFSKLSSNNKSSLNLNDDVFLDSILEDGKQKAYELASKNIKEIKKITGFYGL